MRINNIKNFLDVHGLKIVAYLIIMTLLAHWEIFTLIGTVGLSLMYNLLIIGLLIMLLASAIGLYLKKTWGFIVFYPSVLLTTIGFSLSLIPFITSLFPFEARPWIMISLNSIVLLFVIWRHIMHSQGHRINVNKQPDSESKYNKVEN